MGSTPFRSWSFSRQRTFNTCKRQFFYQYYWKGEPNDDILCGLRRLKTIPLLVGDIVHESISVALGQWVSSRTQAKNLFDSASYRYESLLRASLKPAVAMRRGCRPPGKGPILTHHLMTGERSAVEEAGLGALRDYLAVFEASDAWAFLRHKKTFTNLWEPITTDSDDKPTFTASRSLGFANAVGIRIYAAFDLALWRGGEFILVDWKAGQKTEDSSTQVRKQLTSYCLWALAHRKARRTELRIQPYFLQPGELWAPSPVRKEDYFDVVHEIEEHVQAEMRLIEVQANKDGEPIKYVARSEDFPPEPRRPVCANCKFLTVCDEGKKVVVG